jgi:hypothetical protein
LVVIDKLPFAPPDDRCWRRGSESIEREERNPSWITNCRRRSFPSSRRRQADAGRNRRAFSRSAIRGSSRNPTEGEFSVAAAGKLVREIDEVLRFILSGESGRSGEDGRLSTLSGEAR